MTLPAPLATHLQAFFTERLAKQQQASPHTIAAYRDTFRLLLSYARDRLKRPPDMLLLDDLDAPFVGAFLDQLERKRKNTARTRNARLAAIRSFFRYLALEEPAYSAHIHRVLAMPSKRYHRPQIESLSRPEIDALLAAPDQTTWSGRRDHAILLLLIQTGLRVSELVALRCQDVVTRTGAHVRCRGKGRKERCTPLLKQTAKLISRWMREQNGCAADPLVTNARGGVLSTDGVRYLLAKHLRRARERCSSLTAKRVSPHVLRHTTAMQLLLAGVDRSLIALWLGHESIESTQVYLNASLELKERILAQVPPGKGRRTRYKASDQLLAFLEQL